MRSIVAWLVIMLAARSAAAQCECDHELGLDVTSFDAAEQGVAPGDRICVMAGEREFLRFQHLAGTAGAPITVINCGGRVVIHNEDRAYALVFEEDSHHFRVTGTGDPEIEYGFEISAPDREPYGAVGLWFNGRSTSYEADHIEIHHTGFAGVMAKTDPLCDGSADQGVFLQEDIDLHHLYVHDTDGEGFYIGSTQSNGHTIRCEGADVVHQPHFLEGVEFHDNRIENTGWDGAQIGMARARCRAYRNVIRNVGLERVEYQMQGLQIGTYTSCEVFANVIEHGGASGIFILGAGDMLVHSNRVVGFTSADPIYANTNGVALSARYRFYFNTIEGWSRNGITVFGPELQPSEAIGNLLIGAGSGVAAGGDVAWTARNNVVVASRAEAGFTAEGEYYPAADSVARGAAVVIDGITRDLEGYPRADPPSAGAYEYRDPTVDAGPLDFEPPPAGPSGCGCRAAARGEPSLLALLAIVLVVPRRRRMRSRPR